MPDHATPTGATSQPQSPPLLRPGVRAIVLDDDNRVLLCRFVFRKPEGTTTVWACPGGGIEPAEEPLAALRRELLEETGLVLTDPAPPHVWHQRFVASGHAAGYDGIINDFFVVRTTAFTPRGDLTDEQLAAENVHGWRWWTPEEISDYDGTDLFAPRDLATPLTALLTDGVPDEPLRLGL